MTSTTRLRFTAAAAAATCLALAGPPLRGQAPGPDAARGAIVGTGVFTSFVENMDRSLAFYQQAFGMEVPPLPEGGRPYNRANPQLFAMFDIPGARERHQSARVPDTRIAVELMEIQDVPHATIPLRLQDPGAATLVFIVRDLDAALLRLVQAGAPIVSPGGKPVTMADGSRAILARDVDGRFVELRQLQAPPAGAGAPNLVEQRLSIAVADLPATLAAYRDVLGFTVEGETGFETDPAVAALTGLTGAAARRARVQAPGSTLWIEMVEFKGVERTPLRMRIQDRGAARLQLRAQNVKAVVAAMTRAGFTVMSQGGTAVPIPPNLEGALVADPNNFFLTPFAPCDGCTSGRGSRQ